jgi:hypothetical protein
MGGREIVLSQVFERNAFSIVMCMALAFRIISSGERSCLFVVVEPVLLALVDHEIKPFEVAPKKSSTAGGGLRETWAGLSVLVLPIPR